MDKTSLSAEMPIDDPFDLFSRWMADAEAAEPNDPNSMALATSSTDGAPSVRMVLLKGYDRRGFVFYTNLGSRKARELTANPRAALSFHWKSLGRQIRIEGHVEPVTADEANEYYNSRPRGSRIGAWASNQSQPLANREMLEQRVSDLERQFGDGEIPRPEFWSGFRLVPTVIEFWQGQPSRLHDRLVLSRADDIWTTERLYP